MKKTIIENLFPTPIYMSNINRKFTEKELAFVKDKKTQTEKNQGDNIITTDKNILDKIEFKEVKSFLENSCQDYLDKIISPLKNVKLYITQSWLNYTEENQTHHAHSHQNSIISGVLYIDADKDNDKIKFRVVEDFISENIKDFRIQLLEVNDWLQKVKSDKKNLFNLFS